MITIFTPTYNRAYTLLKLYESLLKQTNKNFEWIVVDDGSKDNTEQLCKTWINNCKDFKITYTKQENHGKHIAINVGVKLAKGELFFIVDSDDFLTDDAIEQVTFYYEQIKDNNNFAGVCGMRAYHNGKRIGGNLSFETMDCSTIDIRNKYKIKGDMAEAFKTDILKKYPFPKFAGEKFLSECAVWDQIGEKYLMRFFNRNIYFTEYLSDGLSQIKHTSFKYPKGCMYLSLIKINSSKICLKNKILYILFYWNAFFSCKEINEAEKKLLRSNFFMKLFCPVGFVLHFLLIAVYKIKIEYN